MPAEYTKLQLALMDSNDREAIEYAQQHGFVFPSYSCTTKDHKGNDFYYEALFSPAQFRAITAQPFPECATVKNCQHLLHIWNKASTDRQCSFRLEQAPAK